MAKAQPTAADQAGTTTSTAADQVGTTTSAAPTGATPAGAAPTGAPPTSAAPAGAPPTEPTRLYTVVSVAVRHDGDMYEVGNSKLPLTEKQAELLGSLVMPTAAAA